MTSTDPDAFVLPPGADASRTWFYDSMHFPAPLPRLAGEAITRWVDRGFGGGHVNVNGYGYMGPITMPSSSAGAGWEAVHLPRVRAIDAETRGRDYAAMGALELVGAVDTAFDQSGAAFLETMLAFVETSSATQPFLAFCTAELGAGAELLGMTMLQGLENESASSGDELGRLAQVASAIPAVVEALPRVDIAELRALPAAAPFVTAFDAYLAEYGLGTATWFEIHRPTWSEQPDVPLRIIARYVAHPEHAPAVARERAREQRQAAIVEAETRLDPAKLAEFHRLRAIAEEYVPVIEGRALWQLRTAGSLRLPIMALGLKVALEGAIDEPEDVFLFSLAELRSHIDGSGLPDLRALARERTAELAHWATLTPPPTLGRELPAHIVAASPELRRSPLPLPGSAPDQELVGSAASRGIVQGIARVIRDLDDGDRLEPGEILVCQFTAPPWTPLFAIAAAVVTDAGGVLSHSAIAAREYGIPCVAGTGDGSRRIPDGATITVDGSNGTVTVHG